MVWEVYNLAKTWSVMPSQLLGISQEEEPVLAYSVNRSVAVFGNSLTNELEKVEGKNEKDIERKRDRILQKWLPDQGSGKKKKKTFRDPAKG